MLRQGFNPNALFEKCNSREIRLKVDVFELEKIEHQGGAHHIVLGSTLNLPVVLEIIPVYTNGFLLYRECLGH
jgi:hypothetical protein